MSASCHSGYALNGGGCRTRPILHYSGSEGTASHPDINCALCLLQVAVRVPKYLLFPTQPAHPEHPDLSISSAL